MGYTKLSEYSDCSFNRYGCHYFRHVHFDPIHCFMQYETLKVVLLQGQSIEPDYQVGIEKSLSLFFHDRGMLHPILIYE